jgi:hypothetical protein
MNTFYSTALIHYKSIFETIRERKCALSDFRALLATGAVLNPYASLPSLVTIPQPQFTGAEP